MDTTAPQDAPNEPKSFKLIIGFFVVLIALVSAAVFFQGKKRTPQKPQFTEKNMPVPSAHMMSADFLPTSETVPQGADGKTEMIVKGSDATKKISGVQLKFIAAGPVKIKDITLTRTDGGALTVLKKEITANEAGIVGVIIEDEDKLPSEVKATIHFTAVSAGAVTFTLDQTSAQVTGPIESNSYELSQADASNFIVK